MAFLDNLLGKSTGPTGRNWTIGKRIKIMTLVCAAITLLVGGISVYSLTIIEDNSLQLKEEYLPEWSSTSALLKKLQDADYYFLRYHAGRDGKMYRNVTASFKAMDDEISKLEMLVNQADLPGTTKKLPVLKDAKKSFKNEVKKYHQAVQTGVLSESELRSM